MIRRKIDYEQSVGLVFGRLTVLSYAKSEGRPTFSCKCSCGVEKQIAAHAVLRRTRSCGCLSIETVRARRLKHGATSAAGSEDQRRTFNIWVGMKARCLNPNNKRYHLYGARGITFDPTWVEFENFVTDMGLCPKGYSIEREDNDGNYRKENCHWLPRPKQAMNRQDTIWIRYQNQEWCFKRLCEYLQVPYLRTYKRYVMRGWDLARSLNLTDDSKLDLEHIKGKT